uniref:RING-type domain-containing protein n=1 Tax=Callorhinchus milii TaxID=7868 RepID=A0A4W3JWC8_CALMI
MAHRIRQSIKSPTVQQSTVQYSTAQYSTVQYSTVQYSIVQHSTVQYSIVQHSTAHAALRTLTCRHIFCHDCLVKTVVNQGTKPKRVVCPVCRHVTFLSKRGLVAMATDKAPPPDPEDPSAHPGAAAAAPHHRPRPRPAPAGGETYMPTPGPQRGISEHLSVYRASVGV